MSFGSDNLGVRKSINVGGKQYHYFSIPQALEYFKANVNLPFSLKVLLENLLRFEDGENVTINDIENFIKWGQGYKSTSDINYRPARVLMQDFTGVPAVVDLAAMRDAVAKMGADPKCINPLSNVDLVIDHSVMVDSYAAKSAFADNVAHEFNRNKERYAFLSWGQKSLNNFKVVPPGTGICHQVNLEYLGQVVWSKQEDDGNLYAYPDTLVGTDSHTTMINGLAILGWGVGGIEAEAAMLGQAISMRMPEVIGFKLSNQLKEGTTATDLVLTVTQMLRERGVVGKFVEFYGPGLGSLPLADRATIANMAPEYGATCGFFPIDDVTLDYLRVSNRSEQNIALVEEYAKAQGMWRSDDMDDPNFTDTLSLDLRDVEPSLAGPKRPQDRVLLSKMTDSYAQTLKADKKDPAVERHIPVSINLNDNKHDFEMEDGHVVIAAITSCTNTSNPAVMLASAMLAKNALARGLQTKPWVKTSLAPGSKVVTDYLEKAGLQSSLDKLGFNLVGYGCTTCIGNSGPLLDPIESAIKDNDLHVASVLSGNRNFEGRVHQLVKLNYLASPPLVVAYALAGSLRIDIYKDPLAMDAEGKPVYLKDIWPTHGELSELIEKTINKDMFIAGYEGIFDGTDQWQELAASPSMTYDWDDKSTYVKLPPFFDDIGPDLPEISDIHGARTLAVLGDSVTTDHISPAGAIKSDSPAGLYLQENGVDIADFNSYGSRRGNHEVMMRGTFANIRIKNEMLDDVTGGYTKYIPDDKQMSIYDAAMAYIADNTPLIVVAGREYGTGSSRDWAAKGTRLLGVKAVIAESFERIHRSNLIGMGVLPLEFTGGVNRKSLKLTGYETFDITGLVGAKITPSMELELKITYPSGEVAVAKLKSRIDTQKEVTYYQNGGILHYVLRQLAA